MLLCCCCCCCQYDADGEKLLRYSDDLLIDDKDCCPLLALVVSAESDTCALLIEYNPPSVVLEDVDLDVANANLFARRCF